MSIFTAFTTAVRKAFEASVATVPDNTDYSAESNQDFECMPIGYQDFLSHQQHSDDNNGEDHE